MAIAALLLALAAACSPSPDELYSRGMADFKASKTGSGTSDLEAFAAQKCAGGNQPRCRHAYLTLGHTYEKQGTLAKAWAAYDQALTYPPHKTDDTLTADRDRVRDGLTAKQGEESGRAPVIIRYRRRVGLWAFAYVCLHLSTYIGVDQLFDWPTIGKDIAKRPYITIGMAAFTLLIPLAVTSADKLRRRLGPRRWKRLHQLIYLVAPMGAVHYYLLVKADHRPPLVYGAIIAALLAWHAVNFGLDKKKAAERKAAKAAQEARKQAAKAGVTA